MKNKTSTIAAIFLQEGKDTGTEIHTLDIIFQKYQRMEMALKTVSKKLKKEAGKHCTGSGKERDCITCMASEWIDDLEDALKLDPLSKL